MAYDSITDFLIDRGYTCLEDRGDAYFYRLGHRICASELTGHTVESFAKQHGLDQQPKWPSVKIVAVYCNGEIVQGEELEKELSVLK